jgi:hypothetical protein
LREEDSLANSRVVGRLSDVRRLVEFIFIALDWFSREIRPMSKHRAIAFLMVSATAFCAGCYTLQPAEGVAPKPGGEVAFRLSDRGRVAIAPTLGPNVSLVRGSLMRRDGDEYVVAMSAAEFSSGGTRALSGDSTRIATADVTQLYVSRVSKPRSIVAATLAAIALGVMVHEALKPTGMPNPPTDDLPGSGDKQRLTARTSLFVTPSVMSSIRPSSIVRWLMQSKR